ncbi:hypothetical protein V2P52_00805 [Mesomycoplasma hyorhinis]|uniref:hypothetical protein n=2 Tax=Mycoplasmoidales TaxID=2790996 RepID=UPI003DA22CE0
MELWADNNFTQETAMTLITEFTAGGATPPIDAAALGAAELKVSEQENSEAPVSEPKEDEKTKKD